MEAKISPKGWIVIPAPLRKKYNLHAGENVRVIDYGGVLAIVPVEDDPISYGAGLLKGNTSLAQMMIAEHQAELRNEE